MKEFALKHPILTFLLCDTLIRGVVNMVTTFAAGKKKQTEVDGEAQET